MRRLDGPAHLPHVHPTLQYLTLPTHSHIPPTLTHTTTTNTTNTSFCFFPSYFNSASPRSLPRYKFVVVGLTLSSETLKLIVSLAVFYCHDYHTHEPAHWIEIIRPANSG